MQHGVTGAVGRRASALRRALAIVRGHAAEGPLIDLAVLGAREGNAVVFEFDDGRNRFLAHVLDGVLITQPIRTLDGVVEMEAPVVLAHVAQRSTDAALRRHGVAAGGKDLGDAGGGQALGGHAHGRPQSGATGTDDNHVVLVMNQLVGIGHERSTARKTRRRMAIAAARTASTAPNRINTISVISRARGCT